MTQEKISKAWDRDAILEKMIDLLKKATPMQVAEAYTDFSKITKLYLEDNSLPGYRTNNYYELGRTLSRNLAKIDDPNSYLANDPNILHNTIVTFIYNVPVDKAVPFLKGFLQPDLSGHFPGKEWFKESPNSFLNLASKSRKMAEYMSELYEEIGEIQGLNPSKISQKLSQYSFNHKEDPERRSTYADVFLAGREESTKPLHHYDAPFLNPKLKTRGFQSIITEFETQGAVNLYKSLGEELANELQGAEAEWSKADKVEINGACEKAIRTLHGKHLEAFIEGFTGITKHQGHWSITKFNDSTSQSRKFLNDHPDLLANISMKTIPNIEDIINSKTNQRPSHSSGLLRAQYLCEYEPEEFAKYPDEAIETANLSKIDSYWVAAGLAVRTGRPSQISYIAEGIDNPKSAQGFLEGIENTDSGLKWLKSSKNQEIVSKLTDLASTRSLESDTHSIKAPKGSLAAETSFVDSYHNELFELEDLANRSSKPELSGRN